MSAWLNSLKQRARRLKREALALWFAYRDPRLPWGTRLFAAYVVARTFSPIDLIPDFIPLLGYLDDLILTPLGIAIALKLIPPQVMADARARADAALLESRPRSWLFALPVIVIWLALLAVAARLLLSFD